MSALATDGILSPPMPQQPTLDGYVAGIIAVDPMVLQCRDCGRTLTQPEKRGVAVFIITSGWHFHTCEGPTGMRRCRDCLAAVVAACPSTRCKQ